MKLYTDKVKWVVFGWIGLSWITGCAPAVIEKTVDSAVPDHYALEDGQENAADLSWQEFFSDPYLIALIDAALSNNQELNMVLSEIEIARNEAMARKGEYLPKVGLGVGAGLDKVGRYTRNGAVEHNLEVAPEVEFPEPFSELDLVGSMSWEVDIWKKLRNARASAYNRYLATEEGKNFVVTQLVAEIAHAYYELLALDNQLAIVEQNIELQQSALQTVRMQKQATRVTELAVQRFEAQLLNTKSLQYEIRQHIVVVENEINFLVGRFPQPVERKKVDFNELQPVAVLSGIPAQLLENRPDVRQAELELTAAKLDVNVTKARFYPSLGIEAGFGLQAFNLSYLVKAPESLLYNLAGDIAAPLINRKEIKAGLFIANAAQIQAAYNYEKVVLNAYIEVVNQIAMIENMQKTFDCKQQEVQALNKSITISTNLFRSARADYMEVLMTQRDALESRFELVEARLKQMSAMVNMYHALGGGWK